MKHHRFFVPPQVISGRYVKIADPELVKQIGKVLRMAPGESLILLDGDGFEYMARLQKVGAREVSVEIVKRQMNEKEPEQKLALYQSLIKKDKIEWVFEKCTEVGVTSFRPILSERSEKLRFNELRARKVVKEAAEQSERGICPPISEIEDFGRALRRVAAGEAPTFLLHPEGLSLACGSMPKNLLEANIFVGPEGGFSQKEIDEARDLIKNGAPISIISLGPRILRAETAGLVAASIFLHK